MHVKRHSKTTLDQILPPKPNSNTKDLHHGCCQEVAIKVWTNAREYISYIAFI